MVLYGTILLFALSVFCDAQPSSVNMCQSYGAFMRLHSTPEWISPAVPTLRKTSTLAVRAKWQKKCVAWPF